MIKHIIIDIREASNRERLAFKIKTVLLVFNKKEYLNVLNYHINDLTKLNQALIMNCKNAMLFVNDIVFIAVESKIINKNVYTNQFNCEDYLEKIYYDVHSIV